ncbi:MULTISPECIES: hypothetical protein [Persicobacter]|uniref:Uncharacterized protein n=1 Tax=Persicobacter diffluens TaxID=981 RepID=A0AAN4VTP0_9BACT|nr:hypothetical protein [Persicobacter sp. CCB-QB2]GJM59894.1 hypothetical protein PEDI_04460 [Persicobacter diffluens]
MAVTRLVRKGKRNKAVAKNLNKAIAHACAKPVIKKVDVEELKKQFEA